jgi:DNA-binding transcriptional LysR family regulator
MELRHLRYFLMVAEERHFTRAAARLNIQQPPLSQQIKGLEQELGFALFVRHPKGVDLTPGGQVFLAEARDILNRVQDASRHAALAAAGYAGSLNIGFTTSAAAHPAIPALLRAFRARYPGVSLLLSEGNARELTYELAEQRLDIGFLRAPVARPENLTFCPLLEEDMLLVLPVGHALLAQDGSEEEGVSLAQLADEPFILVRTRGAPGLYGNLILACEHAGFTPRIALEVERMLTNINLVAAGAGVSVVPASMRGFHSASVVYCKIRDATPRLVAPITLVYARDADKPALTHFVEMAVAEGRGGG